MNQDKPAEKKSNITKGYVPSFDLNEDGFYEEKEIYYPNNKFVDLPEPATPTKRRSKKPKHDAKTAKKEAKAKEKAEKIQKKKSGKTVAEGKRYKKEKKKKTGYAYKFFLILSILIILIPLGIYFFGCMYLDKMETQGDKQTLMEKEYETQKEIAAQQDKEGNVEETKTTMSDEIEKTVKQEKKRYEKKKAEEERQAIYDEESATSDYIYIVELSNGVEIKTKSETEYNDLIAEHREKGDLSYYHWMWDYDDNQYTRGDDDEEPPEQIDENTEL